MLARIETQVRLKRTEAELRSYHGLLEQKVEARTAELRQEIERRGRSEAALRHSEERFATAFRATPDSIIISSLNDGRYLEVNDSFLRNTGYSREEVIGHTSTELNIWADPADRERFAAVIQKHGSIRNFETRHQTKTGVSGVSLISAEIIELDGEPCLLSVSRDITDRKHAEDLLQAAYETLEQRVDERTAALKAANAQSQRLAQAIESSADAIFVTDVNSVIQYVNPAFTQITGWTAEEAVGQPTNLLRSGRMTQAFYENMWDTLRRGEVWRGRILNRRKNSLALPLLNQPNSLVADLYWAQSTNAPIFDENGICLGYVSIQRDITQEVAHEQRRAFEQEAAQMKATISRCLQETRPLKDRFQEVLTHLTRMPDLKVNPQAGIFLRPRQSNHLELFLLHGSYDPAFISQEATVPLGECLCGRAAASGQLLVSDDCFTDTGHERHYPDMTQHGHYIVPLVHANETKGIMFLYTEPHPSREPARLEMLRQVGELMGLALTNEEANQELQRAREVAEVAVAAKSSFLANMSHEIRTPLNAVIGMTNLLLDTPLNEEQYDFVNIVRNSGDALLSVINDILDFSKLEAGRLELEQHPFQTQTLVEEALDLVAPNAAAKHLDLMYVIAENVPPTLVGDDARLRQVLVNLLSNAVKFTPRGEVIVTVTGQPCSETTPPGKGAPDNLYQLQLAVRDTGIGIPTNRRERLFHAFSQVDASTTRLYGGTGLGLAISKSLIEMMHGKIWLESTEGEGTTFHFNVRVAIPAQQPTHQPRPDNHLIGKRVLLVDDSETNRFILIKQVQTWGMFATGVGSGPEALGILQHSQPFDLAILDMQMPGMDGLELARRISQLPAGQGLPMVLLSSLGYRLPEAESVGITAQLTKPLKPAQLYTVLSSVFGNQPALFPLTDRFVRGGTNDYVGMGEKHPLLILLAEDNVTNQKVALRMLERLGYRADVAANGKEVLAALHRQAYDVVLMDVQMPEMDGLTTTKIIHQEWTVEQRPYIIAMTANALTGHREEYLAAGMDDYVSKPVQMEQLAQALLKKGEVKPRPQKISTGPLRLPALDINTLENLYGPDALDMLVELSGQFEQDVLRLQKALTQAVLAQDKKGCAVAAHELKGSSGCAAALELQFLARLIEQSLPVGEWQALEELVDGIVPAYTRFRNILFSHRPEIGSAYKF